VLNRTDQTPLLLWFTVFHINLMYSCIEEESRAEVIRSCYWPLLHLANDYAVPIGVEASGLTLEIIQGLDSDWMAELRRLIATGRVEFVGSGYAQIIGPLVPAQVNESNLRLGHETYERLIGVRPQIAFVNEQAYSSGLVEHYLSAGYAAIFMEWQNPAHAHPEWDFRWRYLPQLACDQHGNSIPLIWNNSIAFQKFQRLAHGELSEDEYLAYLEEQLVSGPRAFSLYGNDVEIFDFRPGRYATEPALGSRSEWRAIHSLWEKLAADSRFRAVRPSQVLSLMGEPGSGNRLRLESAAEPVPVKKQEKYNLTRWSITGRDNLGVNTRCWRLFHALEAQPQVLESDWKELCYLWSSDFRTHITEQRWGAYLKRLAAFERRHGVNPAPAHCLPLEKVRQNGSAGAKSDSQGRFVIAEAGQIKLRLNRRRGLAIDRLWFRDLSDQPLIGTLPHGFYDDISLAADFYSGHLTFEIPGAHKVTDLNVVEPHFDRGEGWLDIAAVVSTPLGPVSKKFRLFDDGRCLEVAWRLAWKTCPPGSLRLGHITLNPEAFSRAGLYLRTHNGGRREELFCLGRSEVDHGAPVSFLVSARSGIGMTGGWVELGNQDYAVRIDADRTAAAALGMAQYKEMGSAYFCRLSFSLQEMDETRHLSGDAASLVDGLTIRMRISAHKPGRGQREHPPADVAGEATPSL
jgi:hypothetical protein